MKKELDEVLSTLSIRAKNCLRAAEIYTIDELVKYEPYELLKFRNFGKLSMNEIVLHLSKLGYNLGEAKQVDVPKRKGKRSITKIENGYLLKCGSVTVFYKDFAECIFNAFAYEFDTMDVNDIITFEVL